MENAAKITGHGSLVFLVGRADTVGSAQSRAATRMKLAHTHTHAHSREANVGEMRRKADTKTKGKTIRSSNLRTSASSLPTVSTDSLFTIHFNRPSFTSIVKNRNRIIIVYKSLSASIANYSN
jgi:hypothetical protein